MMDKYYYEIDGVLHEVELEKHRVDAFKQSNPDIKLKASRNVAKAKRDEVAKREATEEVRAKRRAEYPPISDQLDAIMKWAFSETEIGLPEELKSLAGKCMSVKAKFPLP